MYFTLLLFVLIGAQSLFAQGTKFSLDRMRQIAGVSDLAPSPDGATVAVVVTHPNYADNINESEARPLRQRHWTEENPYSKARRNARRVMSRRSSRNQDGTCIRERRSA
jgi:hypothetical protein